MARRVVGRPAAAWWRPRQLPGIARFGSGRLPAARWRDRNAYRRQDGTWQKYENGGWTNTDRQPADRPQPTGEATNRTTGERTPTVGARWINSIATPLPARKVRNAPATMATTAAGAVRREPAAIAVAAPRVAAADAGGDRHFERPGPVTTRFAVPGTRCQIALSSQLLTALTRR